MRFNIPFSRAFPRIKLSFMTKSIVRSVAFNLRLFFVLFQKRVVLPLAHGEVEVYNKGECGHGHGRGDIYGVRSGRFWSSGRRR